MGFKETQADGIIGVTLIKHSLAGYRQWEADVDTSRLESRIATLRARVRRILALHGLSWVISLVLPVIVALGFLDWLVHLDAAVRFAALIALIGFALWLIGRAIIRPLIVRFGDLDIAMRIEERWPGLNDRLTSTVQFLRLSGDDDRLGSPALRAATIRQTLEETEAIDFREVIERKPLVQALGAASTALVVSLAILMAAPVSSSIALRRLFQPFGSTRWPQQTHLTLLDKETPRVVARGEPFTLGVQIGKGEVVPRLAQATYRFANGEVLTEPLRSVEGGGFRGRLETVERDFSFSVIAGDDTTSIRDVAVKVVPPPHLKNVTIRLIPPAYTGVAPTTLASGNTQVRAVEGTEVEVSGQANKPIRTAALHLGDSPASAETSPTITFDSTRTRLSARFTVAASLPFWFELHDQDGFTNREAPRYDIRAIRDEAPRVVIEEPANDRDVTAKATIPIRFTVDDDFGIQSARVLYRTASGNSEPTPVVALPLWDAKDRPAGELTKHQEVTYQWDLGPLNLPAGSLVTFHAEALDVDTLKGPNLGKSRELRLRIVTDEEITRQLDDQRREIREETARILAMEKQAQVPVNEAIRKLEAADNLDSTGLDNLKNAEMIQRQVGSRITSRTDGLDQKIQRLLDDMKNLKVSNPDARSQLEEMRAGVERIRDKHLGPAEQGLTHAAKNLEEAQANQPNRRETGGEPPRPEAKGDRAPRADQGGAEKSQAKTAPKLENDAAKPDTARKPDAPNTPADGSRKGEPEPQAPRNRFSALARNDLAESRTSQNAIADELQKMLDGLSEFETYRGVVKDAQNLLKEQEQTMKQTADAASKTDLIGKSPENLTPEQKGDLANLADRQQNVSRGLQNLQEQMSEMAKRLDESDPLAAAALREAADSSRKQGTAARMGETADRLSKNQMGEARNGQEQARQELKDLVDSIQNRRERELARLVKELKNAEAELKALKERQAQNLKKTEAARKNPDAKQRADTLKKLAKEQQEIQKELNRQLKKLAKLNAEGAAQAGSRAAARMSKAQGELDQDQGDQAGQDQEEALADLEDAEEQLAQTRKDMEEQLAMEQLAKMGDELKSLAERQAKMVGDITDYEALRAKRDGALTIAQRTGVRNLGRVQQGLKSESAGLAEKLEGAPVFALTLKRAGESMETAAQRLLTLKTDDETQLAARAAARRFEQLISSLKPDKPKNGGQGQGGDGQGGGGGGGDGIPPAAQVKMLKSLQEEINERTEFYDELRRRNRELTRAQTEELERLETDQGTLADLARDLTRPKKEDGED